MGLKTDWLGILVGLCMAWLAPQELDTHLEQIRRSWRTAPADDWLRQVGWMVEHHPGSKLFREEYTLWVLPLTADIPDSTAIRTQLAAAWLRQVERDPTGPVIDNAYRAVVQSDFGAAESLLRRARQRYPADPHWTDLLADLYVSAVVPSWRHSHLADPEVVTPAITEQVMRELAASNDAALLRQAGEMASMLEDPLLRQAFGPSLAGDAWGGRLLARARRIKPSGTLQRQSGPSWPLRVGPPISNADHLLWKVEPKYPADALKWRIQGPVTITVLVRIDGTVEPLRVVRGHPLLLPAADVRQWRYKPTLLNDEPVSVIEEVTITFTLSQ